jgi:release factor glutamine methyltransferase
MGTGSGLLALCAARAGGSIVAVDVNPTAVRCAAENVIRNRLDTAIKVLGGDLFDPIPSEDRFDLIVWNPPFYDRQANSSEQRAWNAGSGFETVRQFACKAGDYLAPGGEILLILTSDVDADQFFQAFGGFNRTPLFARRRLFEKLTVYRLDRRG